MPREVKNKDKTQVFRFSGKILLFWAISPALG